MLPNLRITCITLFTACNKHCLTCNAATSVPLCCMNWAVMCWMLLYSSCCCSRLLDTAASIACKRDSVPCLSCCTTSALLHSLEAVLSSLNAQHTAVFRVGAFSCGSYHYCTYCVEQTDTPGMYRIGAGTATCFVNFDTPWTRIKAVCRAM